MVVGLGFMVWRVIEGDLPSEDERSEHVARLETTVLPVVEDLRVQYFMDEPECSILTYPRGDFVDGNPRLCGGATGNPTPFDDIARADHTQIAAALAESGTPIERLGGTYSIDGRVTDAWFSSGRGAPLATTWSLDYDPGDRLTGGTFGMLTRTRVTGEGDWWFACCAD